MITTESILMGMPMPKLSLRTLLLLFFGFGIVLAFVCQVIFPIREQARSISMRIQYETSHLSIAQLRIG